MHLEAVFLYKAKEEKHKQILLPHEFFLPFGGQLDSENRWAKLALIIPWYEIEKRYMKNFKNMKAGQVARSARLAVGSLIIQNRCSWSDVETLAQITENPYLQYFIGLPRFQKEAPFNASLMTYFRQRLSKEIINEINELIALEAAKVKKDDDSHNDSSGSNNKKNDSATENKNLKTKESNVCVGHQGKLILDATCTPADVHYPTDLWLLNESREKLEIIIDILHAPLVGKQVKPRNYRNKARRNYLNIAKSKRPGKKKIRKAISQQLGYVKRDLEIIDKLIKTSDFKLLSKRQVKDLQVIHEIYRQQLEMFKSHLHKIEDRIVNISQPHVRPIVRGKMKAEVEFGAKLAISLVNGFAFMEELSWDNFNEGITLIQSVERYLIRFGCYPEAILADKIYRNRDNIRYCKGLGIRLNGPRLGRPSDSELSEQQRLERKDTGERNSVEGKFGEGKRFYGLNRIFTRLSDTSETVIAMQILVMNLGKRLRLLFEYFPKQPYISKYVVVEQSSLKSVTVQ